MTGVIIGGGAVLLLLVLAMMAMDKGSPDPDPTPAAKPIAEVAPKPPPAKDTSLPAAKSGKEPTRPAPELTADALAKADAYYYKAKKMNDDGRRAQAAGKNKEFNKLINDGWDTLESLDTSIETYTDWLEEADLEEWRLPPAYVKLQKRLNVYDKLRGRLRRVKGNRQGK